jgi:hypothetical protein
MIRQRYKDHSTEVTVSRRSDPGTKKTLHRDYNIVNMKRLVPVQIEGIVRTIWRGIRDCLAR